MSMDRCDIHGSYDTDFHMEGCPKCLDASNRADLEDANREMGLPEDGDYGDK
jgi:hypothetical protein